MTGGAQPIAPPREALRALPESASFLLDVVRLAAAVSVAWNHMFDGLFFVFIPGLWKVILAGGVVAVPVFFVLSGFVIRYVTRTRETTLRAYAIDRASRMYSVVLPAIALSYVASLIGRHLDPTRFYATAALSSNHPVARLLVHVLFLDQAWGRNVQIFDNPVFWSLGYEVPFYALFACFAFLRRTRAIVCAFVLALIVGPQVAVLFPVWLLGCLLYDLFERLRSTSASRWILRGAALWLLVGSVLALLGYSNLLRLPAAMAARIAALPDPLRLAGIPVVRENMTIYAVGILAACTLLVLLLAVTSLPGDLGPSVGRRFRRVADATFLIYLGHFPLIFLASYLGWLRVGHNAANVLLLLAILILLTLAAVPLDALKLQMRHALRQATLRPAP